MSFEWTTDISVGIPEIDQQHQELFKRINVLLDACTQQKGKSEVGRFLGFLEEYVIEHFQAEEKVMAERKYPAYAIHKQEHDHFKQRLATIRKEFTEFGATIHVVLLAVRTAGDWLLTHIKKTDKALGAFLRGA